MYELAFAGDLPLPSSPPSHSNKRERDADSPASSNNSDTVSSPLIPQDAPRNIAGSRRVRDSIRQSPPAESTRRSQPQGVYTLPVYSEELGRLPVHGQVAFSSQGTSPSNNSSFSYWNHGPSHDINIPGGSLPTRPLQAYPSNDAAAFSMHGMIFNPSPNAYNTLVQTGYPSSSLGSTSSIPGMHSSGIDTHQLGEEFSPLINTQAMDSDVIAMWSNAPSGFEYVITHSAISCDR